MQRHLVSLMTGLLMAGAAIGAYTPPAMAAEKTQARAQEQVYGYELMTEQERAEHRARIRSLKTEQEREQFRLEHHKKMQERAKERGVTLPEEPLPRGKGVGGGQGGGMGGGRP
jgi:UDP-glucose 6-dehydrogenase